MRAAIRWLVGAIAVVAVVWVAAVALQPDDPDPGTPAAGAWELLPAADLAGRSEPAVVWTRKALIVWGGEADTGVRGDGASFDLSSKAWTPLPPAPITPRRGHRAVWTGTTMVVYGGLGISVDCPEICALGDGAAYDPITDTWAPLAPAPLDARSGHTAVFVQNRMVVWGGAAEGGGALADGASYDPATDAWAPLAAAPLEPRVGHLTVATTDRVLVWGGSSETAEGGRYFADGAVYTPATDSWSPMAPAPAWLDARDNAAGVWTGEQLVVWGGFGRSAECTPCLHAGGGAYDLDADTWTPLAPSPLSGRGGPRAVWTGRDMLVWGGFDTEPRADGAIYSPTDDAWAQLVAGPLAARQHHAMVWTGRQLIIWGGQGAGGKLADGAVLTPRAF